MLAEAQDAEAGEVREMVRQVGEKGYSPPGREKILESHVRQDFTVCPSPDDCDSCAELRCPDEGYESAPGYGKVKARRDPGPFEPGE